MVWGRLARSVGRTLVVWQCGTRTHATRRTAPTGRVSDGTPLVCAQSLRQWARGGRAPPADRPPTAPRVSASTSAVTSAVTSLHYVYASARDTRRDARGAARVARFIVIKYQNS
jgi:hypothetical protein